MEHKKKKNGLDRSDRNIFLGIGIMCLIGLFVLVLLFQAYFLCACQAHDTFDQTGTSIVATNYAVPMLIRETDVAATGQFAVTDTPQP